MYAGSDLGLPLRVPAVVAIVAAVVLLAASPASGEIACARALIADWAVDGRLLRAYALPCYEAAIDALPVDLRQYSNAEEDIRRAWGAERRAHADRAQAAREAPRGLSGPARRTSVASESPKVTAPTDAATRAPSPPTPTGGTRALSPTAGESELPRGASRSVEPVATSTGLPLPLPLLVLGALSAILLAIGGSGYVLRRGRAGSRR